MKKHIFISLLFAIFCHVSDAQVNLQLSGNFVRNFNPDSKSNSFGGGLNIEFAGNQTFTKYVGISYILPTTFTEEIEASAFSNLTEPYYIPVTATYKRPMFRIDGGINYYLAGEANNTEGFNWFIGGGAAIIYTGNKVSYSSFDRTEYTLGYSSDSDVNEDGSEKFGLNVMLALGTGIEKNIGIGNLVLQANFAFPVTRVNNSDVTEMLQSFTPIPLTVSLGYKFPLGGTQD